MFTNNIIKTPRDDLYPHFMHDLSINIDRIHEAHGKGGDKYEYTITMYMLNTRHYVLLMMLDYVVPLILRVALYCSFFFRIKIWPVSMIMSAEYG